MISSASSDSPRKARRKAVVRAVFAGSMVAVGIAHLVRPAFFVSIMPPYLPYPGMLVLVSGLAEMAGGLGLMIEKTRVWAGWGLVLLLVCVFPANVNMALHPGRLPVSLVWLRLPLQPALIWLAWWAGRVPSAAQTRRDTEPRPP